MTIELTEVASGYSTGVINSNFEAIEAYINDNLLNRDGTETGEPNQMEVSLDMNSLAVLNVGSITNELGENFATEAALEAEEAARISADSNLQSQISGSSTLEASAFSVISWHKQVVENSVTIPADQNGWSFGPEVEIATGQEVTVSEGSFWTIANGQVVS